MRRIAGFACVMCLALGTSAASPPELDLAAALPKLARVKPLVFSRGAIELPPGGHLQGVQVRHDAIAKRHYAFLSHDTATVAYLLAVDFPADLSAGNLLAAHPLPGDGRKPPLRHAGGIQLLDNVLAVGLEDNQEKTRSEVQFWNVADPETIARLEHLTVRRAGPPKLQTAGAVGLCRHKAGHLLAVANWDCRAIDFYMSNGKPLADPACRFALTTTWHAEGADTSAWQPDRRVGQYQAVNLFENNEKLFLLGFGTSGLADDRVDLFAIDLVQSAPRLLRKLASQPLVLVDGNHFRYGGGVSFLPDGPAILASPRNLAPRTRLSLVR